jgi:LacI family gluconate utilization system Gnt-I transcriptional repressor
MPPRPCGINAGVHGGAVGRTAATLTLERGSEWRTDLGFELVLRDGG